MESIGTFHARWLVENMNPCYPLDLEWFARQPELNLDLPVRITSCDRLPQEVTATLVMHPDLKYYYILYNPIFNDERIRFGIAHELAHLYLGHEGYVIGDDEDKEVKTEADDFASEILMPYFRVKAAAAKLHKLTPLSLVYGISKYFWVSIEATCRKLLDIGVVEGAYFLYDLHKLYFVYKSDKFKLGFPVKKLLIDTYRKLEYKETDVTSHQDSSGRIINLYAQKFSSGKVFGVLAESINQQRAYDDLVQEMLELFPQSFCKTAPT